MRSSETGVTNDPPATPAPSRPLAPYVRDAFVVFGDPIGAGGQGAVYKAVQTSLRRIVALKRPAGRLVGATATPTEDTRRSMTFFQEALTIALLDHPNIVQVHEIGEDSSGNPYLAMKLVRGRVWADVLSEEGSLPAAEFLARNIPILLSVAQAVAFAHSRGVVHRDLNPSQIMVGEFGEVYVMDWGLAVSWRPDLLGASKHEIAEALGMTPDAIASYAAPPLERASAPAGTRAWMAPEQALPTAAEIGPWTDAYLLGGMLYYLLTLTVPHPRDSTGERRIGVLEPPSRRAGGRPVPADLEELCLRATAHDRGRRLSDVREFVRELTAHLAGSRRREEAARLVEGVEEGVPRLGVASYEELAGMERDLTRAIELDPGHAEAARLRESVRARQVEVALDHGDLVLARTTASRLSEADEVRGALMRKVLLAEAGRARQVRVQRLAIGAVVALLAVASGLAAFASVSNVRAAGETARALLAAKEKEAAERTAGLLVAIDRQRQAEGALAREFATRFPLPKGFATDGTAGVEGGGVRDRLFAERARLRVLRTELATDWPDSAALLGPEPFEFVLGEANAKLLEARSRGEFLEVYGAYVEARKLRGEGSPDVEAGLGLAAMRAGFGTSATIHLANAREAVGRQLGTSHPEYALASERLAAAYKDNREQPDSYEKYYADSLAIQEDRWIDSTTGILRSWTALGDSAVPVSYARTLHSVAARRHGRESVEAGRALRLLAMSTKLAGEDLVARDHYREAIGILERTQPAGSAEAAEARLELAEVLVGSCIFDEAYECLNRAIGEIEEVHGADSREMLLARRFLGRVYFEDSKQVLGRATMEDVLARQTELLGPDHPETLETGCLLLNELARTGNGDELDSISTRIEELIGELRERLGPDHPIAIAALQGRAKVHERFARYDESLAVLREQRERYVRTHSSSHPLVELCDFRAAHLLSIAGRAGEALPYLERLRAASQSHPGDIARKERLLRAQLRFWNDALRRYNDSVYFGASLLKLSYASGQQYSDATIKSIGQFLHMARGSLNHAERMVIVRKLLYANQLSPSDNEFDLQHLYNNAHWEVARGLRRDSRERLLHSARLVRALEELFRRPSRESRPNVAMMRTMPYANQVLDLMVLLKEQHPERADDARRGVEWGLALLGVADPTDRGRRSPEEARLNLAHVESSHLKFGLGELPLLGDDWVRVLPPEARDRVTMPEIMAGAETLAPPIDWERLFPEIQDWSMAPIYGDPRALEAEFQALLDKLVAQGEPQMPGVLPDPAARSGQEDGSARR